MDANARVPAVSINLPTACGVVCVVEFYVAGHHEQYVIDIAESLRASGARLCFVVPEQLESELAGYPVYRTPQSDQMRRLRGWRRHFMMRDLCIDAIRTASAAGASIIHFVYADWQLGAIAAAWRKCRPSARLVLTVHWTIGAGLGRGLRSRARGMVHRHGLIWLAQHVDLQVQVHHESIRQELAGYVPRGKIKVVPYPAHALPIAPKSACALHRDSLRIPREAVLILCYGGTRYDKGADLAVRALGTLPPSFHLLIAGTPSHFRPADLRAIATSIGVEHRVHFIPRYLTDDETSLTFSASDVVLMPYRLRFAGQSGPLMQAGAIGKPVVAANLPVIGDTVREYGLGERFDPEDVPLMAAAIQRSTGHFSAASDRIRFCAHHSVAEFGRAVLRSYVAGG